MQGDHTENIDVCCTTWYIIHDVSKMEFNKQILMPKKDTSPVTMGIWV